MLKKKAFDRIVMLCSYHDYSREKMRQRLKREHVDEYAAEDALDRAVECGLIDDIRYGEALCAGRMRAGKGTDGIESELWDNHIDPAHIQGAALSLSACGFSVGRHRRPPNSAPIARSLGYYR